MKRFLTVLAVFALAGAIYVATAPGSQTAGPTMRQFRALQAKVTKLQKDQTKLKTIVQTDTFLLMDCMVHAVPIDQFGQGAGFASAYGYTWTEPDANSGQPWLETALDVTSSDDAGALWITGGGPTCGTDLNASLRKLSRLSGIRLHSTALHSFSARKP